MTTEVIVKYVLEAILISLVFFAYTFVVGTVLPKRFLKIVYLPGGPTDRGLRKYVFPEGRGIVYEPNPSVRKYVTLYILFVKDGVKYIRCKLDGAVGFLSYKVVAFDNQNNMLDVISVSDTALSDGTSRSVMLPKDTSYVAYVLCSVNGKRILKAEPFAYDESLKRIFVISVTVLTALMALAMRSMTLNVWGIISEYVALVEMKISVILTIAVGIAAGLLGARRSVRKNWKNGVLI
jgi:hypothetical protein